MTPRTRAVLLALAFVVLVSALGVASFDNGGPRTDLDRVQALSKELACPECAGQAVSQSNAPAAVNIRTVVAEQVDAGRSDDEIRGFLADRFGEQILLRPASRGLPALVWIIPVVATIFAGAGLVIMFRRWAYIEAVASAQDVELVAEYLASEPRPERVL